MATDRLQGKIAVVTGSTGGIGAAIARGMAAQGAHVVVSGRREIEGQRVVESIRGSGGGAVYCKTDVSRPEDCRLVCDRAIQEFGGLDVLVNNAGIFPRGPMEEVTPAVWDEVFATNVRGVFFTCQAAVPLMAERGGGSIINIGSGNAFGTAPHLIAYGTSKSALYGMTMTLARALAPRQIRVNWITVGWVLTEGEIFQEVEHEGISHEEIQARAAHLPMGRYTEPEEVANGCIYLASDEAAGISGTDLNISAGCAVRF